MAGKRVRTLAYTSQSKYNDLTKPANKKRTTGETARANCLCSSMCFQWPYIKPNQTAVMFIKEKVHEYIPGEFEYVLFKVFFISMYSFWFTTAYGQCLNTLLHEETMRWSRHTSSLFKNHWNCVVHTGQVVDWRPLLIMRLLKSGGRHFAMQGTFELNVSANFNDCIKQIQIGQLPVYAL